MATMKKYVQWVPIAPLNLLGRIQATVRSPFVPICGDQMEVDENTPTDGYVVNIALLSLELIV